MERWAVKDAWQNCYCCRQRLHCLGLERNQSSFKSVRMQWKQKKMKILTPLEGSGGKRTVSLGISNLRQIAKRRNELRAIVGLTITRIGKWELETCPFEWLLLLTHSFENHALKVLDENSGPPTGTLFVGRITREVYVGSNSNFQIIFIRFNTLRK